MGKAIEPDIKKRFDSAKVALSALQSGITNDENASTSLNKKLYYSKKVVPSQTKVEIKKSLDELIITSPCSQPNDIHIFVAIIHIACALLTPIIFGTTAVIFLFLVSYSIAIFLIPQQRNRLLFHYNVFDIYRGNKFIERGTIKDIEDVNQWSDNYTPENWFISIKTKNQRYAFSHVLTKVECIWLVEEIKDWLEQK